MAIVVNEFMKNVRGMIGDLVFRTVDGVTIISSRPTYPKGKQTPLQKRNRDKFKAVSAAVKWKLRDPEVKAHYKREAVRLKLPNAYTAALKEGMGGKMNRTGDLIKTVVVSSGESRIQPSYTEINTAMNKQVFQLGYYLVLLVLVSCSTPKSADSSVTSDSTQQGAVPGKDFFAEHNDTLPYRLFYPTGFDASKKYPLVLFLHGAGALGSDNQAQLNDLPKLFTDSLNKIKYPCFVLAPQCPKHDAWVNFPGFPNSLATTETPTTSTRLTLALVDTLSENLPIDKKRIYITGLSLGGEGTFDFLTRRPTLFAAAVPICAVADTSKATSIKHIPVWIFHGDEDDVNSVAYSRLMVTALKRAGGNPKYTEYKGVRHDSWTKAYAEPDLPAWLFSQK